MITELLIAGCHDNFGSTLELDTLLYPLSKFHWYYDMVGERPPKHQQAGSWKAPKFVEALPIEMEGEILSSTTTEYWTRRKALMQKIIPPQDNISYDHVKFLMKVDGDVAQYYVFTTVESNVGALDVAIGSPTVSEFQLSFECKEGYWRNVATDAYVVL